MLEKLEEHMKNNTMYLLLAFVLMFGCTNPMGFENLQKSNDAPVFATTPTADKTTNYSPSEMSKWKTAKWGLGANYTNGTSTTSNYITFGVYAPNATRVLLEIYTSPTGKMRRTNI